MFSIIVLVGLLCTLTAFTVGCGDAPKKAPASPAPAASPAAKTTTAN